MDLTLNGAARQFPEDTTVAALLEAERLTERRVAVEVDGQIVPRSQHATFVLQDGCRVEVVHALGGG